MNTVLLAPEIFAGDGGITRILRLYLKALCELAGPGGSVRLVALNDSSRDPAMLAAYADDRLAEVVLCGRSKPRFSVAALRASRGADRIVCGHVGQLPVAWAAAGLRSGIPYHLVAHGIEVWRPFSALERRAIRGARSVWCVSAYTRARLAEHCPLPEGRLVVLPNALDPAFGAELPSGRPAEPPVILCVSRLSTADAYKGVDDLIRALPAVRRGVPGARLRIVGRGDAERGLAELARRTGVEGAVDFLGFVGDAQLAREFDGCRVFALPSEREGFGLVYLEAMAHGRPCVGARAGGTPEVITEETGTLVPYGDVPMLGAALTAALQRDWDEARIRGRARAFSYPVFRERLRGLLAA